MTTQLFFDANCTVGRVSRPMPGQLSDAGDILAELERHGVTEALVSHVHAVERSVPAGNDKAVEIAAQHRGAHPVWVLPQHSALDVPEPEAYVRRMLDSGVRAVRVPAADYHGYLVAEWALGPVWRELERHQVPVLLSGSELGKYPDGPKLGFSAANVYELCRTFPRLPIVILRLNFSALRVVVPLMRECPNLYVENSFFTVHRGIETLAGQVGAHRILFGSGMPWGPPGPAVVATMYADVGEGDRRLVAGDNLRRLLAEVET